MGAQCVQRQVPDVYAVQQYASRRCVLFAGLHVPIHVVKALQQLKHRGLASAAGTHQCHGLAGRQVQ